MTICGAIKRKVTVGRNRFSRAIKRSGLQFQLGSIDPQPAEFFAIKAATPLAALELQSVSLKADHGVDPAAFIAVLLPTILPRTDANDLRSPETRRSLR